MKMKFILSMIVLLLTINIVSSEMNLWTDTIIDNSTNTVNYHGFYQFSDTSANEVGRQKPIELWINYDIQSLPYTLTYGTVDYCNLTTRHILNRYDSQGFLIVPFINLPIINLNLGDSLSNESTSVVVRSEYFTTNATGKIVEQMFDKDSLEINMVCHYTDIRSLYEQNVLVGRFTTFIPSYSCSECSQYSLEQLSNEVERNDDMTKQELSIYDKVQTFVDYNFKLWDIMFWLIKIGMFLLVFGLVFIGMYYMYKNLKELSKRIGR